MQFLPHRHVRPPPSGPPPRGPPSGPPPRGPSGPPGRSTSSRPWTRRCFTCRAGVISGKNRYIITQVLLDSGAAATIISRELVNTLRLRTVRTVEGKTFDGIEGKKVRFREKVCLIISIAGVMGCIQAYVGNDNSFHLLIGVPGLEEFDAQMHSARDPPCGILVTVTKSDPSGSTTPKQRYIIDPEPRADRAPIIGLQTSAEFIESTRLGAPCYHPSFVQQEAVIMDQRAEISRLRSQLEGSGIQKAKAEEEATEGYQQIFIMDRKIRRLRHLTNVMQFQTANLMFRSGAAFRALQSVNSNRTTGLITIPAERLIDTPCAGSAKQIHNVNGRCHFRNGRLYDGPRRLYEHEED